MKKSKIPPTIELPKGVIFNAYPDSIGINIADTVDMLRRSELKDVFSLFYILPTFFNSDLDRGFSIIDYDLNDELVSRKDLEELHNLNIKFKFDLVLNHLSVGSPQFQDLLKHGDSSNYKDFFIDWNEFWQSNGEMGPDGYMIPNQDHLEKLFMRKPGLPILKVRFPDGSERPYWNTFYQEVNYPEITSADLLKAIGIERITQAQAEHVATLVNNAILAKQSINEIDFNDYSQLKDDVISFVEQKRQYLGQMDLNGQSQSVWDFYEETLKKLHDHGGKLIRLDAFSYLHKEPGKTNFFNKPGTWEYLERLKLMADKYDLILLPEIHAEHGTMLHDEVAAEGFPIYDFFFPGLIIHALDKGTNRNLYRWINELLDKNIKTINMLGCHDGIPVLDLRGKADADISKEGLLSNEEIDVIIDNILKRGGRVKNLYGPDGKKISYYQVNATFFSALGEDERKLRLARAVQIFMPGIPQVWYLDLFAGKNDYEAADKGGTAGHKEINRTTLTTDDIERGLKRSIVKDQLELLRLRNTSPAFNGVLKIGDSDEHILQLTWKNEGFVATLNADLRDFSFTIKHNEKDRNENVMSFK
jgi:glycosidase